MMIAPQEVVGLTGFFHKSLRRQDGGFCERTGETAFPGSYGHYLTVPRSFTVIEVAGMASMASETVISPLNILATRSA